MVQVYILVVISFSCLKCLCLRVQKPHKTPTRCLQPRIRQATHQKFQLIKATCKQCSTTCSCSRGPHKHKIDSHKKQCVDCKAKGKKMAKGYPVEMKFKCIKCGVALCQDPCFRDYHVNM